MSSFAYYNVEQVSFVIGDAGGDAVVHLYRAPEKMTLVKAYAAVTTAMGSSVGAALQILNYGTAGTANGGTVVSSIGGSAAGNAFATANVPVAMTIADGDIESGEWLVLNIDEQGDWQGGVLSVMLEFRPGKSA